MKASMQSFPRNTRSFSLGAMALCILSTAVAQENANQAAHVHGVVQLEIATDANQLILNLTAPKADITGFEHAPANEKDKQAIAKANSALSNPQLFTPNAEAACQFESVHIDGLSKSESHDHDKEHTHKKEDKAHAKHDHDHKHDEHGDHDGHSDVSVEYHFKCEKTEALRSIANTLHTAFPSIHLIEAKIATANGQFSRSLRNPPFHVTWE